MDFHLIQKISILLLCCSYHLVENSFKHGEIVDGKLSIQIVLRVDKKKLDFIVKNSVKNWGNQNRKNGIGLKNLEKRLALLYRDKHSLIIHSDENSFEAQLSLIHTKEVIHG
jgi:two-component system, LytTR family, sensor kinase